MIELRAIGWRHPRCETPMLAAADAYRSVDPNVGIEWEFRPLADFNDQPVAALADAYDLLIVDHPGIGAACEDSALLPFDDLLDGEVLAERDGSAVGPSHASYRHAGRQWALGIDAACHVSAARPDVLDRLGVPRPATWGDVYDLAAQHPGTVALPLGPPDAICALLTVCANLGRALDLSRTQRRFDPRALDLLAGLVPLLHPASLDSDPPALLDRMTQTDEVSFVPLTFGYVSYAGVRFGPIPHAGRGPVGALLGGAGIAVSSRTAHPDACAAFATWVTGEDVQRTVIAPAGGQPADRTVWSDPAAPPFFGDTLATMETAYVRANPPWWPRFQEAAGHLVHDGLAAGRDGPAIAAALEDLVDHVSGGTT